jgi:putative sigma-54 modulation protein
MENIKINIKATNIDLTENIKDHVNQKISMITKFMKLKPEQKAIFDIEIGKTTNAQNQGNIMRAEINLEISGSFNRTESTQDNLFQAIDDATNEMIRKVRKSKEKKFDLIRKGASKFKNFFRRG